MVQLLVKLVRKGFNPTKVNGVRGYAGLRFKETVQENTQEEILEDI